MLQSDNLCAFALNVNCFLQNNFRPIPARVRPKTPAPKDICFLPAQMCNVTLAASQEYFVKFFTISECLMMPIRNLGFHCSRAGTYPLSIDINLRPKGQGEKPVELRFGLDRLANGSRFMITPGRIKQLLERKPFRPFKLCLSDGSSHTVPHPEFAW